jgi:hypothetical protein
MARIPTHTAEDAPAAARPLLAEMIQFSPTGRLLNMHAQMAHCLAWSSSQMAAGLRLAVAARLQAPGSGGRRRRDGGGLLHQHESNAVRVQEKINSVISP